MQPTLRSNDQHRFTTALKSLISPLDYPDADAWRSAVARDLKSLFGADRVIFWLSEAATPFHSEDHTPEAIAAYAAHYNKIDLGFRRRNERRLEVWNRRMLFPEGLSRLHRSECYNDFLRPNGIGDSMGIGIQKPPVHSGALYLHRERPGTDSFGESGLALLHHLYPALTAGVNTYRRLSEHRASLARTIDRTGSAILLCDAAGRVVHQTPQLERLLAPDAGGTRLLEEALRLARPLCAARNGADAAGGTDAAIVAPAARVVQIGTGRFRLETGLVGEAMMGVGDLVMVTIRDLRPKRLPVRKLRERFRLTRAEVRVAQLLAEGLSNAQIAERLTISPHTARHHTERILRKLGIHSRRDVAATVLAS